MSDPNKPSQATEMPTSTTTATTACIYCDSAISRAAKVCPVCQRVQNKLRNQLLFFSSMIGLFSFAVAIVSSTYKEIHELYRAVVYGDQVIAIDLHTNGRGVFYNNGYRTLYLARIDIEVPQLQFDQTINIFQSVAEEEFVTVQLGVQKNKDFLVEAMTENTNAANDPLSLLSEPNYFAGATLGYASDYQHTLSGEKINTYPCQATLFILPPSETTETPIAIECIGVIYKEIQ